MRTAIGLGILLSISSIGCGSDPDSGAPGGGPDPSTSAFNPPPAPEGYTRLSAKTIPDIGSGADVTHCQYLMAPFDRDMDIVHVGGYQSKWGHHAVAFSQADDGSLEIGGSIPCMGSEFNIEETPGGTSGQSVSGGTYLGGVGGEGAEAQALPEGVAFRLKAGQGIVLNLHYINMGDEAIDGDAVVDIQFAEVDPNRNIAALFLNLNGGFNLMPGSETHSSIECVAKSEVKLLMMANHMHEYGLSARTEVVRAGTEEVEVLRDDPTWAYEMQFNPEYQMWTVDDPFVIRVGDTLRTSCTWQNTTGESITFPREMCIGAGFALASGDKPSAPVCYEGNWIAL
jgi:hypothetical protein